ncbi:hypothetical protein ACS0TY_027837 [Phlomoides rotata]
MKYEYPFWMETLLELQILVLRSKRFNVMIDVMQNITNNDKVNIYDLYMKFVIKGSDRQVPKILETFTTIDMSENIFCGSIPESMGKLNSLRYLNLSHNNLTRDIPSSIGNMTTLESLDLSSNQLHGEIPTQLTNLTFLTKFNLARNVRFVNCVGISPSNWFDDKFNDSSVVIFPIHKDISLVRLLCDKFKYLRELSFPMNSGILPQKMFSDISIVVKVFRILGTCRSKSLITNSIYKSYISTSSLPQDKDSKLKKSLHKGKLVSYFNISNTKNRSIKKNTKSEEIKLCPKKKKLRAKIWEPYNPTIDVVHNSVEVFVYETLNY